ncbi:MAG: M48 family metallopeptidase [Alphaproteobacteria bacterium]|nr:M48 family metallopeptidase [Alphaproteobacteria bacterium]MDP7604581.1 M48 family metallopeptidase [Alphaproteobacteria bacterium]
MTSGRFFDGASAKAREVDIVLAASSLALKDRDSGRTMLWPLTDIRLIERRGARGSVRLGCVGSPDARLSFNDPVLLASLERHAKLPTANRGRVPRHLVLVAVAALAVLVGALALLPSFAGPLARVLPPAWSQALGRQTLQQFEALGRTCKQAAGSRALEALLARLVAAADSLEPLLVHVLDHKMVNAFALPGGHIVFLHGLIEEADSADEVAGVLAHEMGHVIARHPLQGLIRRRGYQMVVAAMSLGATSAPGLSDAAAGAGALLLEFANTREHERVADEAARRILERAGISRQGMADFFRRLEAEHGSAETGSALSYLSTHPPLEERAQAATKGEVVGGILGRGKAMPRADWQALRAICKT